MTNQKYKTTIRLLDLTIQINPRLLEAYEYLRATGATLSSRCIGTIDLDASSPILITTTINY